jgi:hypothetical protein
MLFELLHSIFRGQIEQLTAVVSLTIARTNYYLGHHQLSTGAQNPPPDGDDHRDASLAMIGRDEDGSWMNRATLSEQKHVHIPCRQFALNLPEKSRVIPARSRGNSHHRRVLGVSVKTAKDDLRLSSVVLSERPVCQGRKVIT